MNKKENRMAVRQTVEKAVIRDEQNRRIQSAATNPVKEVLKILHTTLRPLINDFLRKMAKFRHQENQDVSAGTRIRFFIDKPAAMISFPRAVIKYL
jgi:dGTP triphosphohydrolase